MKIRIELLNVDETETDVLNGRIYSSGTDFGIPSPSASVLLSARLELVPVTNAQERQRGHTYDLFVTTDPPYNDSALSVIVELTTPKRRAVKEYSALLDVPSTVSLPGTATTSAPVVIVPNPGAAQGLPAQQGRIAPPGETTTIRGTPHIVQRGESLSDIAQKYLSGTGLDLYQMLIALYRPNAYLFADRNMNRMEVGTELSIPPIAALERISSREAAIIAQAQYKDFLDYKLRVARGGTKPSAKNRNRRSSSGQKTAAQRKAALKGDQLTLSNAAGGNADGSTRGVAEDSIAKQLAEDNLQRKINDAVALNKDLKAADNYADGYLRYVIYGLPILAFLIILIYFLSRWRRPGTVNNYWAGADAAPYNSPYAAATFRPMQPPPRYDDIPPAWRGAGRNDGFRALLPPGDTSLAAAREVTLNELMDSSSVAPSTPEDEIHSQAASDSLSVFSTRSPRGEVPASLPNGNAIQPDFDVIEDDTKMGTTLDMARAYLEIGDRDNARDLFNEVILFGSPELSQEAKAALQKLNASDPSLKNSFH